MAAYYWNGGHPVAHGVSDISNSGIYLLTEERWHSGTLLVLTLQKKVTEGAPVRSIRVQSKVIRQGDDGVGLMFLFPTKDSALAHGTDRKTFIEFSHSILGLG